MKPLSICLFILKEILYLSYQSLVYTNSLFKVFTVSLGKHTCNTGLVQVRRCSLRVVPILCIVVVVVFTCLFLR